MLKKITLLLLFSCANIFCQEFTSIWNTTNTTATSSADNQIEIPTNPAYTYNYTIDWGDGDTDTGVTGNITHTYAAPGNYTLRISGDFPAIYFNDEGDNQKIIEILSWGNIEWQTMENAFFGCINLNFDAINSPDLSRVTSLRYMFRDATNFNGIINDWDVSTITDISGMFYNCSTFNRPLDRWDTSTITNMSETFRSARNFNEPLDNWRTESVTDMSYMFHSASSFNQNINNWIVSNVTNMEAMFTSTTFNLPLNNWNVNNVTNMTRMFYSSDFNLDISNWAVNNVTNMSGMFGQAEFNQSIGNWTVTNVTDMSQMFYRNRTFNQPLNDWNVSNVTDMSGMFDGFIWGQAYNYPLNNWDVSKVTDMSHMFRDNLVFNQDISSWNVSEVIDMENMFKNAEAFNQDISSWTVTKVTNMSSMFSEALLFNQPLNNWDVSNVTNMSSMFLRAEAFNQPLNLWVTTSLTTLSNTFYLATSFNQDISNWNTSLVTNMRSVFFNASSFDQNIGNWDMSSAANITDMLSNTGISQENYDAILIAWSGQTVNPDLNLGANTLQYCDALNQRQSLIDDDGWTITGDNVNCSFVLCSEITSPHASDTATPANSDIRWSAAPNATGYRITLEFERAGVRNYVNIDGNPANNYDVGNVVGLDFTNEFTAGDTIYVTVVPYNAEGPATGCPEISFTVVDSWVNSPDAFKITIDTRNLDTNSSALNQYLLELNDGYPDYLTYDFNVDWGDGQYDNNVSDDITHTYLVPGVYTVSIIGDFPSFYHSTSNRDNLKLISMDQWGTQVWGSMRQAFYFCENMVYNATDVPNLTQVTNMASMFRRTYLFNNDISNWDVSNVTNMSSMFYQASIFNQPLNSWNVSNATSMYNMFASATAFNQPLDLWNVSSVTSMQDMFNNAEAFNQPLNNWNVSSVTSMQDMFENAEVFNGDISNWYPINVTNMSSMFENAQAFNQPIDGWNVGNVLNMTDMFNDAIAFNQNIDSWNVSNVASMHGMFESATAFNQPLNSWIVSSVTNMSSMFRRAIAFNQPLNNWEVRNVNTMANMFDSASIFNGDITNWDVTNVTAMQYMFNSATAFNQPLNNWEVNSVVNMEAMFRNAQIFNQPLDLWDVSAVANMSSMFEDALIFNQPINTWDVSSVTLMESMFESAEAYDQVMNNWNVSVVTNFQAMFKNALIFNQPLPWDTSEALTMAEMFSGATLFNQDLDSWNVSFVTTMEDMFNSATAFNQNLTSWNVASVNTMEGMFQNATAFDGDITSWNVRAVTTMADMFNGAVSFNQPLNNWRTYNVISMDRMFNGAITINQPFNQWLIGGVSMRAMFNKATAFNQNLGDWDVSGVSNMQDMLDDTALSRENYDSTLIAWSEQTLSPGINLGANSLLYCDAIEERQSMIDNFGWNFSGDVLDCPIPECTQLISPLNEDTDVPVNTNITWEPVLYAESYRLTVGTTPGGNDILDNEIITNETSYEFTSNFNTNDVIYITIIPFNYVGDAVGPCSEENFTISGDPATAPECTSLLTPLDGSTDVEITSGLSWSAISNADGYRITVGTTSGGNDILDNEDVGNVTEHDFNSDLPEDTDIFVIITPYNDEGNASGCTEDTFKTELIPIPPACTMLSNPLNNATNIAIDTSISWDAITEATGYLVSVGTTSGGIQVVNSIDVNNITTYSFPDDLQENRIHYVRITPYNAVGDAIGCIEEQFTTGDSTLNDPPLCTTLFTPLNSATDVALNLNGITWNTISNATGYTVSITGSSSTANNISNLNTTDTFYNFSNMFDYGETVTVSIIPYNNIGDATGCMPESFTIISQTAPACTVLNSPMNGNTDIARDLNSITWNPVTDATGYTLSITGNSSTANNISNLNTTDTFYNFSNMFDYGEIVTVSVIPYNDAGSAISCTSESFTIINQTVPACTALNSPMNGNTGIARDLNSITWNPVTDASGYTLSITGSSSTANNISNLNTTDTFYNFSNMFDYGEIVTVSVIPYNDAGSAISCTSESFTIINQTAPACTILNSPTNGASDIAQDLNSITWNPVTDATGYTLSITGSTSTANNISNLNTTDTFYNFSNAFDYEEMVTVSITPYNDGGSAIGCTTESFTIISEPITPPDCTTLSSPINGSTNIAIDTNLSWNTVADATGYFVTVGTTFGGSELVEDEDVGNETTFDLISNLPENAPIYVVITPYNDNGEANACTSESFTTESLPLVLPSCTNLLSPTNGSIDIAIDTDITWEAATDATGYIVTIGTNTNGNDILDNEDVGNVTSYSFNNDLDQDITYFVNITPYNTDGEASGCIQQSFTTEPQVLEESKYGFSPNGDGINEFWEIVGIENSPDNTVNIFNRWGDLVFTISNYDNLSRVFRGEANRLTKSGAGTLPNGTYFFDIKINGTHNLKKLKGFVVIKR